MMKPSAILLAAFHLTLGLCSAQPPGGPPGGPSGGPPGGPGGFGPPGMSAEKKIVKEFDANHDGWLNSEERKLAREEAKKGARSGPGGRGGPPGGPGFGRGEPAKPGPKVEMSTAKQYSDAKLFDTSVLRTVFIEFEANDWEQELQDFRNTDVDVPAKLTIDGKTYPNVGIHFRGMSSYFMVPFGSKRSLNVTLDLADKNQKVLGAKSLNLLNAHEDPTYLNTVLYSQIAGRYLPTPKANFVKVVINGESWGLYTSVQQFDKEFLKENYKTDRGTRWKVRGSPGGGGGLEYLGDKIEDYQRRYEMKTGDGKNEKAWKSLINLCKVLNTTPTDKLEEALRPILDIDGLLWYLALDVSLINCDGYWIRASDYSIYLDDKNKFHIIPHDMNEAFRQPMGPGMFGRGGPPLAPPGTLLPTQLQDELKLTSEQKKELIALQKLSDEKLTALMNEEQRKQWKEMKDRFAGFAGGPPGGFGTPMPPVKGVELDPLVGLNDARKPLRSKVLAVPALQAKYLECCRTIAEQSLDWKTFGPVVKQYRALIEKEIEADTRKLEPLEAFQRLTADDATESRGREMSLRAFADQRRKYLLEATTKK
jgi:spore coat protein CotH